MHGSSPDNAVDGDRTPPTLAELDTPATRPDGRSRARTGRAATVTATTDPATEHGDRSRAERAATVTATTDDFDADRDNDRSPSPAVEGGSDGESESESDRWRESDASGTSEHSQQSGTYVVKVLFGVSLSIPEGPPLHP